MGTRSSYLAMSTGLLVAGLVGCAADAGMDVGMDESADGVGDVAVAEASADVLAQRAPTPERFSFFVTSLRAMREYSKSSLGFGGDLRFGETGAGAGLRGADKLCATIAEDSLPGSGSKVWRAFLSTVKGGPNGGPVHAKDRIGNGPWYDRAGRVVGLTKTDLIKVRPASADPAIKNDLPNEDGVPNHNPDGTGQVDNHDILTGTNDKGELYANDVRYTCDDWTKSKADAADSPRVGHSWPRSGTPVRVGSGAVGSIFAQRVPPGSGFPGGGAVPGFGGGSTDNWMSALNEAGCGAGVSIIEMGPPRENNPTVGSGGGYGGIYCFALTP
ncbi:MAG: hypothetical protein ABW252_08080 [Polyangiales bacterium]